MFTYMDIPHSCLTHAICDSPDIEVLSILTEMEVKKRRHSAVAMERHNHDFYKYDL